MNALLSSLHYNSWVLPALLAIPAVGALVVWAHGAFSADREAAAPFARRFTFWTLVVEFVVSARSLVVARPDEFPAGRLASASPGSMPGGCTSPWASTASRS